VLCANSEQQQAIRVQILKKNHETYTAGEEVEVTFAPTKKEKPYQKVGVDSSEGFFIL